jgi:hypothetical protein
LVNNYQQLSNNFYLSTDCTDNTDFLLVNNYQQLFNNFYLSTDCTDNTDFLLVNNYQQLFNNFYLSTDYTDFFIGQQLSTIIQQFLFVHRLHRLNRFFYWSTIINNYPTIFICPQITQIKQIFLLVQNYQQLFKNYRFCIYQYVKERLLCEQ